MLLQQQQHRQQQRTGQGGQQQEQAQPSQQPSAQQQEQQLRNAVGSARWEVLAASAWARARGACEVTGLPHTSGRLHLLPVWTYNEDARAAQLRRLALVCEEVVLVSRALSLPPGSRDLSIAAHAACCINGWYSDVGSPHIEAADREGPAAAALRNPHWVQHLECMRALHERILAESWAIDVQGAALQL